MDPFASSPPRSRYVWRAFTGVALLFGTIYFFVPGGSDLQLLIYQALGMSGPVAILVGLRRYRPARYHHWVLIAGGLGLWGVGDGYWDAYRWLLGRQAPYPSFADVAYLGAYPLLIAGVLVLFRGWGRPQLGDLLDGAIIAIAAGMIALPVLLEPLLTAGTGTFETVIAVGFPVADFVMLMALIQLVFRSGLPNFSLRCVAVGLVALVISDSIYSYLSFHGTYTGGMWVDAGWLVCYGLWGVAALHPSMARIRSLPRRSSGLSFWRAILLLGSLLTAPLVLVVEAARGVDVSAADLSVIVVLTALVGLRVLLLQRQREEAQAALAISEQSYRTAFEDADGARAALAAQNDQLRELDALKDDLIALVSHELRTPLTSIVGYLELVMDDEESFDAEQREFLHVVDRNAHRLLGLVSDLLFVAQFQAGRMTLARDAMSLRRVVENAVAAAAPTARSHSIELSFSASGDADVVGDEQRLGQVIDNLLSNALKFTPPGGSVAVSVAAEDDSIVLEVADTGFGISPEDRDKLFTRFFRTESAMKRAIQGTGLGLSIAKAIVEGHGGTISVESAAQAGATFRVAIPRAATANEPIKAAA